MKKKNKKKQGSRQRDGTGGYLFFIDFYLIFD